MRDPKIEALRRQINVLIEATNRFQLQSREKMELNMVKTMRKIHLGDH